MRLIATDRPADITWRLAAAGIPYEVLSPVTVDEYEDRGSQGYQGPAGVEVSDDAGARWDAAAVGWAGRDGSPVDKTRYQLPVLVGDDADEDDLAAHVDAVVAWVEEWRADPKAMPWPERHARLPRWTQ